MCSSDLKPQTPYQSACYLVCYSFILAADTLISNIMFTSLREPDFTLGNDVFLSLTPKAASCLNLELFLLENPIFDLVGVFNRLLLDKDGILSLWYIYCCVLR